MGGLKYNFYYFQDPSKIKSTWFLSRIELKLHRSLNSMPVTLAAPAESVVCIQFSVKIFQRRLGMVTGMIAEVAAHLGCHAKEKAD